MFKLNGLLGGLFAMVGMAFAAPSDATAGELSNCVSLELKHVGGNGHKVIGSNRCDQYIKIAVYQGAARGMTECRPNSRCEKAFNWNKGQYKYQICLEPDGYNSNAPKECFAPESLTKTARVEADSCLSDVRIEDLNPNNNMTNVLANNRCSEVLVLYLYHSGGRENGLCQANTECNIRLFENIAQSLTGYCADVLNQPGASCQ